MSISEDFFRQFKDFFSDIIIQLSSPNQLQEALLYATMNGGKRMRPLLCSIFAKMITPNIDQNHILYAASSIEAIHCYSLVHDDLPAMDNDDLRRGLPTTHKKYSQSTAILVGDGLQTLAFSLLSHDNFTCSATTKIKLIQILSHASGAKGMVNGQFLDMTLEGNTNKSNINDITIMHQQKTGALIQASCLMGSMIGGLRDDDLIEKIKIIGQFIGQIFQIQDDILDITQSTATLGKTAGKDIAHNKPTMTSLMGLNSAEHYMDSLIKVLKENILMLPFDQTELTYFVNMMVKRKS
ncbi:MAG: geranylgeranyl pyrophosphate synthase [Alphaproteobacteria bacterium]|jgi:geranylgeranyl pyrophosphate synthase